MRPSFASMTLSALLCAACAEEAPPEYHFSPVEVGGEAVGREPRPRSNSQFLRSLYADVLGRAPETYELSVSIEGELLASFPVDEQSILLAALDGSSDVAPVRALFTTALLESAEVDLPAKEEIPEPEVFIRAQFRRLLGREPGVYELETFVDSFRSDPSVQPRTVIRALIESREYQSR